MARSPHRSSNRRHSVRRRSPALLLAMILIAVLSVTAVAQPPEDTGSADTPIRISADRLVARAEDNTAEFIGNVRAVQGDTVIRADRMKIRYARSAGTASTEVAPAAIDEIESSGHVTIHFGNKVAQAEKALYNTHTQVLVLSGADTRVTSGDNSVSGERITVYRREDRITVESTGEKRVEAIIYSGQQGMTVPGTPEPAPSPEE